jgi:hypothetical protein
MDDSLRKVCKDNSAAGCGGSSDHGDNPWIGVWVPESE